VSTAAVDRRQRNAPPCHRCRRSQAFTACSNPRRPPLEARHTKPQQRPLKEARSGSAKVRRHHARRVTGAQCGGPGPVWRLERQSVLEDGLSPPDLQSLLLDSARTRASHEASKRPTDGRNGTDSCSRLRSTRVGWLRSASTCGGFCRRTFLAGDPARGMRSCPRDRSEPSSQHRQV
jgi:hypothetical protein